MSMSLPMHFLVVVFAGWMNRKQQAVIEYLQTENEILKSQFKRRRLRLTDEDRCRLGVKGRALGRKLLTEVACIVTPDTILAWHHMSCLIHKAPAEITFLDFAGADSADARSAAIHRLRRSGPLPIFLTSMRSYLFPLMVFVVSGRLLSAAPAPDFAEAHRELVSILKDFIRINTMNPPANETKAAKFLQDVLTRDGIASEILEKESGRGNLVARLIGNGRKKPLLLMGHLDTVPVEREKWTVDPLAAVEKDGYLYGRGATDDKTGTTVFLQVFRLLHRLKVPLDRDVIFLAEAAEEMSTGPGIQFLVEAHWDKISAEFALNEGGITLEENGKVKYVGVSAAEKVPRRLYLSAKGESGHGSKPRPDNAIVHLAGAIAKFGEWQPPLRLNEITRIYFQRLAAISTPGEAWLYTHLEDRTVGRQVEEILRRTQFLQNSMLRTSVSPTVIKGGFQANVIPGDALATLDIRALPDEDMTQFAEMLRQLINDPAIEITPVAGPLRPATPPSRVDTELFLSLERAQKKVFPAASTLPQMDAFATDSAQLRAKGVQAYGISPVTTAEDNSRMHGNDERINIANLGPYLEFVWTAVLDVVAPR